MSTPERHDDLVHTLGELGKMAVPVEDQQRAEYRRERLVRLLGTSIAAEGRRTRRAHLWPWLYVAAAGVLAVSGAVGWSTLRAPAPTAAAVPPAKAGETRSVAGDVSVRRGGQTSPLRVGDVLVGGETVATSAEAVVEIGIDSGRAELEGSSELVLVRPTADERRLRLGVGSVDVDLPRKLESGRHLVVETPDVEVRVVGTAFTVDVGRGGASSTRVRVRRGTVWIMQGGKQRAVLNAGDDWTSATQARAAAPVAAETDVAPAKPRTFAGNKRAAGVKRPSERGTLVEENRLFQTGLSARNAGDHGGAAEAFGGLLARYPRSVLREQALAEQFRALERAGRSSAATVAARRYLAGYPSGFARSDAERVTGSVPSER
jgi:hypothetical protein